MQIDMGPGTHRALSKLTFEQEAEILMASSITVSYVYIHKVNIFLKRKKFDIYLRLFRIITLLVSQNGHFSHARFLFCSVSVECLHNPRYLGMNSHLVYLGRANV